MLSDHPHVWGTNMHPPAARTAAERNARASAAWAQRLHKHRESNVQEWPDAACDTVQRQKAAAEQIYVQQAEKRAAQCPCCGSSGAEGYHVQRHQEVLAVIGDFSLLVQFPVRSCKR